MNLGRIALLSQPMLQREGDGSNSGGSGGGERVTFDAPEQDEAERQRQIDADKAKGDFEKVETELREELEKTKTELKDAKSQLTRFQEAMKATVDGQWKDLPEKVAKLYKGDPEDALARLEFLNDPDYAELAKELAGDKREAPRGAGGDPPRGGASTATDAAANEQAQQMNSLRYG